MNLKESARYRIVLHLHLFPRLTYNFILSTSLLKSKTEGSGGRSRSPQGVSNMTNVVRVMLGVGVRSLTYSVQNHGHF